MQPYPFLSFHTKQRLRARCRSGRRRTLGALAAFHVTTCCGIATKLVEPGASYAISLRETDKITIDWVRAGRSHRTGRSPPGRQDQLATMRFPLGMVGNIRRMTFDPRYAIVTASDSGIGKATAVALAEAGMDVGITWHSDSKGADATAEEVRSHGRKAVVKQLDYTDLP
jgi:hypothetical protein